MSTYNIFFLVTFYYQLHHATNHSSPTFPCFPFLVCVSHLSLSLPLLHIARRKIRNVCVCRVRAGKWMASYSVVDYFTLYTDICAMCYTYTEMCIIFPQIPLIIQLQHYQHQASVLKIFSMCIFSLRENVQELMLMLRMCLCK